MGDDETSSPNSQDLAEKVASLTEMVTQQQNSLNKIFGDQVVTENDNPFDKHNSGNSTTNSMDDVDKMMLELNNEQDNYKPIQKKNQRNF